MLRNGRSESWKQDEPLPSEESSASFLWIIAAGAPTSLVTKLKLERCPRWPPRTYLFGDDILPIAVPLESWFQ